MDTAVRIGIDARFWGREHGGFSTYTQELLHNLALLDSTTEYLVFLRAKDIEGFDISQPNILPVLADFPHYSLEEQTGFFQLLKDQQLDLVHFLNFNHPLCYRGKFITTLHDLTLLHNPVGRSKQSILRRQAFLLILRHSLKKAARVIAISEFSAKDAEAELRLAPTKVEVIYEGVPPLIELPFGSRAIIQTYLGTRDPYFLFVSQWRPHKGIMTLIEGFEQFKATSGLPHRLVLAGKPEMLAEEVAARLARSPVAADIIAPGFVPDNLLPSLYHSATAFIMPSEYEGFGLPVLEAMRYGAPTIVADNSALPEVGGAAALYFPTGDSKGLALRLTEVVENPQLVAQLQNNAVEQVAKFSWQQCAKQTLKVYAHVLEKEGISATVQRVPRWRNR